MTTKRDPPRTTPTAEIRRKAEASTPTAANRAAAKAMTTTQNTSLPRNQQKSAPK